MSFDVTVVADSVSPAGVRLTTVAARYPRIIHAEMMTHRAFSRNGQSTRGIPSLTLLKLVKADPFIPAWWGKNQKGMQAFEEVDEATAEKARQIWFDMFLYTMKGCEELATLGVHKQLANRPIEPFSYYTLLISSTDWANFFALRRDAQAQPEIRLIADYILRARRESKPQAVGYGRWHLPFIRPEDIDELSRFGGHEQLKKVSAARCARVSYLNHFGIRDLADDLRLFSDLVENNPPHMSPLEHQATPLFPGEEQDSNYRGWHQHRKEYPNECQREYDGEVEAA